MGDIGLIRRTETYLINIVVFNDTIKECIQIIQHINDLHRQNTNTKRKHKSLDFASTFYKWSKYLRTLLQYIHSHPMVKTYIKFDDKDSIAGSNFKLIKI